MEPDVNIPLQAKARQVRDAFTVNPRAVASGFRMYTEALALLASGISLSGPGREQQLLAKLLGLEQRMKKQIEESCRTAPSIREIGRREAKIAALYRAELEEIKKEIDQLTNDTVIDGGAEV
jgi:hypothetical protein